MEKKITEQESLQIINEMIAEARDNFNGESGQTMEYMGYAVSAVALLNIILMHTLSTPVNSFFVWLLMFPISIVDTYRAKKRKREVKAVLHVETIIDTIWKVFGLIIIVFLTTVFVWVYAENRWILTIMIMPCILLFTAFATYITGVACKYKPYKRGGIVFGLGAITCIGIALTPYYPTLQFAVLIVCMILGFIVPSRQLNNKTR